APALPRAKCLRPGELPRPRVTLAPAPPDVTVTRPTTCPRSSSRCAATRANEPSPATAAPHACVRRAREIRPADSSEACSGVPQHEIRRTSARGVGIELGVAASRLLKPRMPLAVDAHLPDPEPDALDRIRRRNRVVLPLVVADESDQNVELIPLRRRRDGRAPERVDRGQSFAVVSFSSNRTDVHDPACSASMAWSGFGIKRRPAPVRQVATGSLRRRAPPSPRGAPLLERPAARRRTWNPPHGRASLLLLVRSHGHTARVNR